MNDKLQMCNKAATKKEAGNREWTKHKCLILFRDFIVWVD